MNIPNQQVLQIIHEIVEKSSGVNRYIYRGESKHYRAENSSDTISSSLYRLVPHYKDMNFNIKELENIILNEAKGYIEDDIEGYNIEESSDEESSDEESKRNFQLLTEIQHFGGVTNLIDFTEDYLIALFFACDKSPEEPGRVIMLTEDTTQYRIHKTSKTMSRVAFQKSVFVEPIMGFIRIYSNRVVNIPAELKQSMLSYLQKYHGISHKTIYSDLHGFIRHSAYAEVCKGFDYQKLANKAECWADQEKLYNQAIAHYTDATIINSKWVEAYYNRGRAYLLKREAFNLTHPNQRSNFNEIDVLGSAIEDFEKTLELVTRHAGAHCNLGRAHHLYFHEESFRHAIRHYDTAIDLNPEIFNAYCNRGEVYLHLKEWERAKNDLIFARENGIDIIESFHNDYRDFEDFEERNQDALPPDLKELLTA